jgi:hypothetical protein
VERRWGKLFQKEELKTICGNLFGNIPDLQRNISEKYRSKRFFLSLFKTLLLKVKSFPLFIPVFSADFPHVFHRLWKSLLKSCAMCLEIR